MAHTVSVVYGSTTITLSAGDYRLRRYARKTAEGSEDYIEESMDILVTGTNLAGLTSDLRAINRAFEIAKLRADGRLFARVYLQVTGDGETTTWQTEILGGRVLLPESLYEADWANKQVEITLAYSRAPFWEGDTWIAVPLTNGNGTDLTSGIRVYNCNDATGSSPARKHNYVDVDGVNDISSELPCPVKLRFLSNAANGHREVYIGSQADLSGFGLTGNHLEAEDFTAASGSDTAGAAYSGGYAVETAPVAGVLTETLSKASWDLSAFPGSHYRFFLCTATNSLAGCKAWMKLVGMGGGLVPASSGLITTKVIVPDATYIIPLGDMPLPTNRSRSPLISTAGIFSARAFVYLEGGDVTAFTDVLYFLPTDSWLELATDTGGFGESVSYVITQNDLDPKTYVEEVTGGEVNPDLITTVKGGGVYLWPGVNNRVHFLASGFNGAYSISSYLTVEMWYKPRRQTL